MLVRTGAAWRHANGDDPAVLQSEVDALGRANHQHRLTRAQLDGLTVSRAGRYRHVWGEIGVTVGQSVTYVTSGNTVTCLMTQKRGW